MLHDSELMRRLDEAEARIAAQLCTRDWSLKPLHQNARCVELCLPVDAGSNEPALASTVADRVLERVVERVLKKKTSHSLA